MAKKVRSIEDAEVIAVDKNSSNNKTASNDEIIENLKTQYQEYSKAAEDARTMALKALGALEVLTSLKQNE